MNNKGFTLVELITYISIFGILSVIFTSIFFITSQSQTRQNAESEVNQQSNFVLQTIQRLVASSSTVAVMVRDSADNFFADGDDTDVGTGSHLYLRLRGIPSDSISSNPGNNSTDPIQIYLDSTQTPARVVIKKGRGASAVTTNLTTNKVVANSLTFTKRSNYPSHDSVSINMTLTYNGTSPNNASRNLISTIARVSAATFDTDVYPGTNNSFDVGTSASKWRNGYFQGDVSVTGSASRQTLEVNGGLLLNTTIVKPSCTSSLRGMFWVTQNAPGTKDDVEVCAKSATDAYAWRTIY